MSAKTQRCLIWPAQARQLRTGLSTLEALGCVIAVLGGAWIGALYLGVDLQQVAHTALVEADVLDKVPPAWRPEGKANNASGDQDTTLREELSSLRNEITALHATETEGAEPSKGVQADVAAKQKTLGYWKRLNAIALSELSLQQETESAFSEDNAAKVFAIKGRTSEFTAKAIATIPTEQVDPAVVEFGEQLEGWYKRSGQLYENAVEIWDRPKSDPARESMNKEWRSQEMQHRHEARLLQERATRVRNLMSRQFGEEFPAFAQAAEPTQETESTPDEKATPEVKPSTEPAEHQNTEAATSSESAANGEATPQSQKTPAEKGSNSAQTTALAS